MILVQGHAECSTLTSKRGDKEMYSTQYAQGLLKRNVFSSALVCCKSLYLIRGQRTRTYCAKSLTDTYGDTTTQKHSNIINFNISANNGIPLADKNHSCLAVIAFLNPKQSAHFEEVSALIYSIATVTTTQCQHCQRLRPNQNWINAK